MPFSAGDILYAVGLVAVLLAGMLLTMAIYQAILEPVRKRRKASQMLRDTDQYFQRVQILRERADQKEAFGWQRWIRVLGTDRLERLQALMLQADVYQSPGSFWGQFLLLDVAACLLVYLVTRNLVFVLLVAVGVLALPYFYLRWKKNRKALEFEGLMPDAMELLARSLRAGHTLPSAIELLGEEMSAPMGPEFRIAYEEQKLGIGIQDSLLHMLQRVDSMDLRYFVSAVSIQQETGGNLAELMENIAAVVRSRLNFKAKVRGLSASGRISAIIMTVTPFVAFVGLMVVAPNYEKVLFTSAFGQKMLIAAACAAALGSYLIRRLIQALET